MAPKHTVVALAICPGADCLQGQHAHSKASHGSHDPLVSGVPKILRARGAHLHAPDSFKWQMFILKWTVVNSLGAVPLTCILSFKLSDCVQQALAVFIYTILA